MILVGISGKKGTGKDTLASFLKNKYGFINLPFADVLKEQVRKDFGFTRDHTDGALKEIPTGFLKRLTPETKGSLNIYQGWTPREIMIAYGQFFRQFDENWWVKKVFDKIHDIKVFHNYGDEIRICISDVRFQNEANYIRNNGGFVVRLNRPQELNIYKEPSNDISETDLDSYKDFHMTLPKEYNIVQSDLDKFSDMIMKYIEVQSVGNSR